MADSGIVVSRKLPPQAKFSWMRLPAELRLMHLEAFVQQTGSNRADTIALCKEWQQFIKERKLQRLRLKAGDCDLRDVHRLERMSIRYRRIVRHIFLDI
jgi:hypothetical protein